MTVTTYGDHAENAARALNALIRDDMIPSDEHAVDQLLRCRAAVVDALRQRLYDLGQDTWYPPGPPARAPEPVLTGPRENLATLVGYIAFTLPTLPQQSNCSPLDVLGAPSSDPTVAAWREAAIELLSGSHALSAATDQPWRHEAGTAWWVMRDLAVALEAVVVLDTRLAELGLLAGHDRPPATMGLDETRMVLSQVARGANWYATSSLPDEAAPRSRQPEDSRVSQPIVLVSSPGDLAEAQRLLARFLRPLLGWDTAYDGEPEISADCARHVTASQLYLCRAFADASTDSPKTKVFIRFFQDCAEVLEALQPQLSYLADVTGHPTNMRRLWQQGEITSAVSRMLDRGGFQLQPTQSAHLAEATHEVTHNLGRALRLELLRKTGNLVDAHPRHFEGPVRVDRKSRLCATVTDLVNVPAPHGPEPRFSMPLQRAALKATHDLTPLSTATPSPFPGMRSGGCSRRI